MTEEKFNEKFEFTAGAKKKLAITAVIGIVLVVIGMLITMGGNGHEDSHAANEATQNIVASTDTHKLTAEGDEHGGGHSSKTWLKRLYSNIWINNVYFTGIAIIGVFFFALQYAAQAGWAAGIKRVSESFGYWLPFAGLLMLAFFFIAGHDIFHWTHENVYDAGSEQFDTIINGKRHSFSGRFRRIPAFRYFILSEWFCSLVSGIGCSLN